MKKYLQPLFILLSFVLFAALSYAQEENLVKNDENERIFIDGLPVFTDEDFEAYKSIPEMKLPESYRNRELPVNVDNSLLPYFRPIFNQTSLECGQASGVAYAFTYEMDRLRNLPANVPENQYPSHFVFNWSNQGSGSACSFFDSWDIIRQVGTPNVVDYGGALNTGGVARWMSGYDLYFRAMKNRIWEFYSISLKNEDGLLTLKHWINDHLDGSVNGGVANVYCAYSSVNNQLPAGTPEAGKYVITNFSSSANHALCIVGYHDSIRWDYNNDGQYTNHLDINNDGIVDFRDWEIGGVKLANSYSATNWGNNGFAYCTYNALCRSLAQSGVWNQSANIMYAKENTNPQLTYKVKMTHDCRNRIKVMAGVSSQPNATTPEYVMGFPILNYQGGAHFMQGGTNVNDKTLEFGLDVTPLLAFVEKGQEATYFLMVDEEDADNIGTGLIDNWSVMDYTSELVEIPCSQANVPLVENGLTMISIGAAVNFNPPDVLNADLPPAVINEPYENQMLGTQGVEPYRWWLHQNYNYSYSIQAFPNITAQQLTPNSSSNGYASKEIDFDFPFYGNTYDKIYIHTDGYLMFEAGEYPWTFVIDDLNIFRSLRSISPYMAKVLGVSGGGMWYEGDATKATFRWKATEYSTSNILNFAVTLYPSGLIEFYYGSIAFAAWNKWYAGVSNGDVYNNEVLDISNTFGLEQNLKVTIEPEFSFTEMALTRDGKFYGTPTVPYENTFVDFYIQDANGLRNVKSLPFFTDGINDIIITNVIVESGGDDIIEYGESASLTVELKNISEEVIDAQIMKISLQDEFVTLTDSLETLTPFQPGETKIFTGAFGFDVSLGVPNNHDIVMSTSIITQPDTYNSHIYKKAYSPLLTVAGYTIDDGGNGYLEPGEDAEVIVQVKNLGGGKAYNVMGTLTCNDPYVTVNLGQVNIGTLSGNQISDAVFTISIDESAPIGYSAILYFDAAADFGFTTSEIVMISIGFVVEDFETGDFSQYSWEFSGNAPWNVSGENPFEGLYCMKSGAIDHLQKSEVLVTMNVLANSEITFHYKVSSEPNYDFLKFSIDGNVVGSWSGSVDWSEASFAVEAGERIFKWAYEKDVSVVNGGDCVWVDYIIFPPSVDQTMALTAGPDIQICQNQTAQMYAFAVNAVSYLWTTQGDGTFSDPAILTPFYTPGNQDISTGSALLTITAFDAAGESLSDDLTVFITNLPIVWAGEDFAVCADVEFVDLTGVVVNTDEHIWSTSGDGTFENPTELITYYYPGTDDINSGNALISLTGNSVSPCVDNITHSFVLTLWPLPDVTFAQIDTLCVNWPSYQLVEGSPAGGVYSGPGVTNGWFDPGTAGVGTHILTYDYTDTNGCEDSAQQSVLVDACTGVNENSSTEFSIHPNPNNGFFTIVYPGFGGKQIGIEIFNSQGKLVYQKQIVANEDSSVIIKIDDLIPGVYYVKITNETETASGKLIIN